MTVTKEILKQYTALKQEEEELKRRRQSISAQILNLEEQVRIVSDTVTCGKKNKKPLRTVRIQGIDQRPAGVIVRKRRALDQLMQRLDELDAEILDTLVACEEYLKTVKDSWIRQGIRYRYIDGMEWSTVGKNMNTTPDSIRMAVLRYLEQ